LTTPEALETASDTAEVRKTPKMSGREQAWWAMAHALEDLVREQGWIRESTERQEELLEELASNTKVIADAMDLFTWGNISLGSRRWKAGRPEKSEMVMRRHRMMGEKSRKRRVM